MENRFKARGSRRETLIAIVMGLVLALAAGSALAAGLIDLNSADQKTIESLPGVGPAVAQDIVKGRPYKSVDDLAKVKGIGKAKLAKIRPLVTVGGTPAAQLPAAAGAAKSSAAKAAKAAPAEARKAAKAAAPAGPVNINSATREQIEALPGIGPVKAQAIIDGRPYQKPEDVMKVRGIKQGIYKKIEGMITVR